MGSQAMQQTPALHLRGVIADFVRDSPLNHLWTVDGDPIWDEPLVGFADGDDPIFEEYKSVVGPHHMMPRDLLKFAVDEFAKPTHSSLENVSVISWVLPAAERIRESNRRETREPSRLWMHSRYYGEIFNDALRYHVMGALADAGYYAMSAPIDSPMLKRYDSEMPNSPTSNWSERHAAYAAGLGTFSLSDGLITPKGVAMRCGSVVTNLPIPPNPRPYKNHTCACLYLDEGTCGECIARCPAGAITPAGHDKMKCHEYAMIALEHLKIGHGVKYTGCGLCQVGIPCENGIPDRRRQDS